MTVKKIKTPWKQVNIAIPVPWIDELRRKARVEAALENADITYLDLIRRSIAGYLLCEKKK